MPEKHNQIESYVVPYIRGDQGDQIKSKRKNQIHTIEPLENLSQYMRYDLSS